MARGRAGAPRARADVRRGGDRHRRPCVGLLRASGGDHARGPGRGHRRGRRHGRAVDARVSRAGLAGRTARQGAPARSAARVGDRGGRGCDLRPGHADALPARSVTALFFLASANSLALTAVALAQGTPPGTAVALPRIADATVTVDGRLDEPAWTRAAVLRDFSQYLPNDDRPAEDSTVVLVWYAPDAIYFGIREIGRAHV